MIILHQDIVLIYTNLKARRLKLFLLCQKYVALNKNRVKKTKKNLTLMFNEYPSILHELSKIEFSHISFRHWQDHALLKNIIYAKIKQLSIQEKKAKCAIKESTRVDAFTFLIYRSDKHFMFNTDIRSHILPFLLNEYTDT